MLDRKVEKLFTENETNQERLYGVKSPLHFVKDAFHRYIVNGEQGVTHPEIGTKAAAHYVLDLAPGESSTQNVTFPDQASFDPGIIPGLNPNPQISFLPEKTTP